MPTIEDQDAPRRVGDGKGMNASSFSDAATPFDVFEPHEPHENPGGYYSNVPGAAVDNTRPGMAKRGKSRKRR